MQNVVFQSILEVFYYPEKEARWNQPIRRWSFAVLSRDACDGGRDADLPLPAPQPWIFWSVLFNSHVETDTNLFLGRWK